MRMVKILERIPKVPGISIIFENSRREYENKGQKLKFTKNDSARDSQIRQRIPIEFMTYRSVSSIASKDSDTRDKRNQLKTDLVEIDFDK